LAFPGSSPEERATARPPPRNPESADSTARAEQEWAAWTLSNGIAEIGAGSLA